MGKKLMLRGLIFTMMCCFGLLAVPHIQASAASGVTVLKNGKTITYRLDGKTKSRIKMTQTATDPYGTALSIYINGAKKLTIGKGMQSYSWDVKLAQISSRRSLFIIRDKRDNDQHSVLLVYEYKNGDLRQLIDLSVLTKGNKLLTGAARGELIAAGKNKITVQWNDVSVSTGNFSVKVSYRINGEKINRIGSGYKIKYSFNKKNIWTASRSIQTYTRAGGKIKAFRIKKDEGNIKVFGMTAKRGKIYMKVKNSKGRTGWYCDMLKKDNIYGWFKEAIHVG